MYNSSSDPRRPDRVVRYKSPLLAAAAASSSGAASTPVAGEDTTADYMNVIGMVFSMVGLLMRVKWCAWMAVMCSCVSFANARLSDDTKQILSSFMLSISAVVMSYLQNPEPMKLPWHMLS